MNYYDLQKNVHTLYWNKLAIDLLKGEYVDDETEKEKNVHEINWEKYGQS